MALRTSSAWSVLSLCSVLALSLPATSGDDAAGAARVEALRRDLRSETLAEVAQAAYAAGRENLRALVPDLVRTLAERPKSWSLTDCRVVNHLLDALIRMDAKVPSKVLARFEDRMENAVLILSLRNGADAHPFLRKALGRNITGQRIHAAGVAAGNVLTAAKDPALAALFLGHVEPEVSVTVVDHDRLVGGGLGRFGGHGDGWCETPPGFPPAVWYELTFYEPKADAHEMGLLVHGPTKDVWYERWENPSKRFICGDLSSRGDVTDIGLGWAESLLGKGPDGLPLKRRYSAIHRWAGRAAYLAFIEDQRKAVQRDAAALSEGLIAAGFLTAEDRAGVVIRPRFRVQDDRDKKDDPLPGIDGEVPR